MNLRFEEIYSNLDHLFGDLMDVDHLVNGTDRDKANN